jgi:hypothetical protein
MAERPAFGGRLASFHPPMKNEDAQMAEDPLKYVTYWEGRPIADLSKEELVEAFEKLGKMWQQARDDLSLIRSIQAQQWVNRQSMSQANLSVFNNDFSKLS